MICFALLPQNSRKFTEIYGNPRPRAACAPCIEFLAAKNTVDREYFKFSTRVVPRFRSCVLSYWVV